MNEQRPDHRQAQRILSLLDLTNLQDDCTSDDVVTLCQRARSSFGSTAAVCIWPRLVKVARDELAKSAVHGSEIAIATVVNFPHGGTDIAAVVNETEQCLRDGAQEIDCVLPYRALIAGDIETPSRLIDEVHRRVSGRAHLKIILETGELPNGSMITAAARLAIDNGADFIKTSTGKTPVSATPEAARLMLDVIAGADRQVGLKPSGGIRTVEDAQVYLNLADEIMGPSWATPATFRFGASGLLDAVLAVLRHHVSTQDEGRPSSA